jgi:hypothetical protein
VWRSDREPETQLVLSGPDGENTGAGSVLAGGRIVDFPTQTWIDSSGEAASVAAVALDEVLKRFERVKMLKLDCEGSEFPILLTSRELARVQEIVGEIHELDETVLARLDPESVVTGCYRIDVLVDRLKSLGFVVAVRRGGDHMYLINAIVRKN